MKKARTTDRRTEIRRQRIDCVSGGRDQPYVSSLIRFCLFEDVFQSDFGVVIPRVVDGLFPILNGLLWAPLKASQALLASVKPCRLSIAHLDISGRTDFRTDSTTIAFIVHAEFVVHLVNGSERHFIDPREDDVLPKRSPVHLLPFPPTYRSGNGFHFFLSLFESPLLYINRPRTAPGGVIGRHHKGTTQGERSPSL